MSKLGSAAKSMAKAELATAGLGDVEQGTPVSGPFQDPVAVTQEIRKLSGEDILAAEGKAPEGAPLSPEEAAAVGILLDAPSPGPSPAPVQNPAVPQPPGADPGAAPAKKGGLFSMASSMVAGMKSMAGKFGLTGDTAKREAPQLRGFFRAGGGEVSSGSANDTLDGLFADFEPVGGGASRQGEGTILPEVQRAGVRRREQEMGDAAQTARQARSIDYEKTKTKIATGGESESKSSVEEGMGAMSAMGAGMLGKSIPGFGLLQTQA